MNRTYTIRNLHSKAIEVELAHQDVCVKFGRCSCCGGAAASLRIARGRKVTGQPAAIALCGAVKALEKQGRVAVFPEETEMASASATADQPRSEGRKETQRHRRGGQPRAEV
jgi:hypothetical protein